MNSNFPENSSAPFGYLPLDSAEALEYKLEIAGMGARAHAFIIDWHIRLLLALAWLAMITLALYSLSMFDHKLTNSAWFILLVPAGLIYFLYHPVVEMIMAGRTPGKRMAGVRLVTLQGHTPSFGALLLRNIFRLIDSLPGFYFVGLVAVAMTKKQVRIGDIAAGVVLVYDHAVDNKAIQKISLLARHSSLSDEDQALLLDIQARWKELAVDTRIRLARQFLRRIGQNIPDLNASKKNQDRTLKQALDNLLIRHSRSWPDSTGADTWH